jgi:hypothetical protein
MLQSRDYVISDILVISKKLKELDGSFMTKVDFGSVPLEDLVNLKEAMRILYLAEENLVISDKLKKDGAI